MQKSDEMEEETRVLVSSSGAESPVIVCRVDGGRFRIMDFMGFNLWLIQGGLDLDDPEEEAAWEDAGFGWLLEVDELRDGRLFVHRVVPDPSVEVVCGLLVPPGVLDHPSFQRLMDTVLSLGGGWEMSAGGILSAFVPRRAAEGEDLDLDDAIRRVLSEAQETGRLSRTETPEIVRVLSPTTAPPEPDTVMKVEQVRVPFTRGMGGAASRGFVLHIPHASDRIPDDVRSGLSVSDDQLGRELARLTDWFTDDLFGGLIPGAREVVYGVSRLVADPERFEDDAREPMASMGFGAVYTRTSEGQELRPGMGPEAREDLLQRFYRPHHQRLEREVAEVLEVEDRCLLIDCHSFPRASIPFEGSENRPDICIGTDPFHTPSHLRDALVVGFQQQGFSVMVNDPFAGVLVPQEFFGTNRRVEAVMVEVGRWVYMDESALQKRTDFAQVRDRLRRAVHAALFKP